MSVQPVIPLVTPSKPGATRTELVTVHGCADMSLLPNPHDICGNFLAELSLRGLPSTCLDLDGPRNNFDESSGVVAPTTGLSRKEIEPAPAELVGGLFMQPKRISKMSRAATEHASHKSWTSAVVYAFGVIGARIGSSA